MIALATSLLLCSHGKEIADRIRKHPQYTQATKIALIQTLNEQLPSHCKQSYDKND